MASFLNMANKYNDYKGNSVLAVAIFCTFVSTLSFIGRVWGRFISAVRWGLDDLLMGFAMVSYTSFPHERAGP